MSGIDRVLFIKHSSQLSGNNEMKSNRPIPWSSSYLYFLI